MVNYEITEDGRNVIEDICEDGQVVLTDSILETGRITIGDIYGSISATSSVSGTLSMSYSLKGAISAVASVSGSLSMSLGLSGAISASSSVSGTLLRIIYISGDVSASSSVSGTLSRGVPLTGTIAGVSTLDAEIAVRRFAEDRGFYYAKLGSTILSLLKKTVSA